MKNFKVGNIVRHVDYGWIGRVQDLCQMSVYWTNSDTLFVQVRWFDAPKKYRGLYKLDEIELNTTDNADTTLLDWFSTPNERLRNALAKKASANQRNRPLKGIRLDGRR